MTTKLLAYAVAAMLLGSAAFAAAETAGGEPVIHSAQGIAYVSGGVGAESIAKLQALVGDFNLKLVFALTAGDYLSGIRVVVTDKTGKMLLESTSEGPWFLLHLPIGDYQVGATFAGISMVRQVVVGAATRQTVDFRWATDSGK